MEGVVLCVAMARQRIFSENDSNLVFYTNISADNA